MTCKTCNGTGHDKAGRPVISWVPFVDEHGKSRKRHVTKSLGSGCPTCLGKVTA